MLQQELVWSEGPLSVYKWSKLDLGTMLHRRQIVELLDDHGQPVGIRIAPQMPRLVLADGVSLSVQACKHSYSSPRDNKGPYTKVEVGFPSEIPPEAWKEFAAIYLQRQLEFWTTKAAKLKLLNEHETYKWEYDTCLEKIALFQRLLDKRQEALLRSSSIKDSP